MTNEATSPAKRTYRVWADHVTRVYQEVEAVSPQEAHAAASTQPECWENCYEFEDRDDYRLSDDVQDMATEDYISVADIERCGTCGSEIVSTINDSNFKEGECGPCEYQRYRSQPGLLTALSLARDAIVGVKMFKDRCSDEYKRLGRLLDRIDEAFTQAYGNDH
jgi:hypothetical protein